MGSEDNQIATLRRAVIAEPRNGELRYLLGAELAQQRDYESAILEMSAAIAFSPFLHAARLQLGLLHLTMGQSQHSIAVLAPLEELEDASPFKHFKRGLEALIADDFPTCLHSLQQGIELNKENEALNRDVGLIIARVSSAIRAAESSASSGREQMSSAESAVRTDFSLYGAMRH